jgi:flavin-binding protein dodecin
MLRRITAAHKGEHESDAARPFRRCKIRDRTRVEDGKVTEYRTRLQLSFKYES